MPEIKFKHIVSCSSEDKVHKAENLLKPEMYRKWKCASPGEKNASIILQFEKACEIHSIDIGNESSAFVEILVGKSSDTANNYQVLLAASSFMSPLESRNDTKNNRVRMFGPEKLAQNLKNEKWDCVQIVCTQPFNKNVQYGLSFIKFHSPPDQSKHSSTDEAESKESLRLDAFKLKADGDDSDKLAVGSLFQKRNESTSSLPVSGPAAIRQASSFASSVLAIAENSASKLIKASAQVSPGVKRKHSPDTAGPSSSNNRKQFTTTRVDKDKIEFKTTREEDKPSSSKTVDIEKKPTYSKTANTVDKPMQPKVTPFSRIMEKVVFVLSGFQNPYRSELRDKALEMGAKYQGDWNDSCTHLICAFLNTPKYTQVLKEKGRIVTKEWILDCHKKKKHLPWRRYMLGKYSKDTTTEEEESGTESDLPVSAGKEVKNKKPISDIADVKVARQAEETTNKNNSDSSKTNGTVKKSVTGDTVILGSEEEDYQADTESDDSSDGDTEDEIRKVEEQQAKRAKLSENQSKKSETLKRSEVRRQLLDDSPSEETDDESLTKTDTKDLPLPDLPEFFKGKHFFVYGDFSSEEMHKLNRYIIGFNGSIEDYMGEKVKFVITNNKWDKTFDEALSENDNLIFVRPQWIFKCGRDCRFVPYQPYIVVPDA